MRSAWPSRSGMLYFFFMGAVAWAADGPSNRQISSAFAKMEPAGEGPPPPDGLKSGDVVIVIDPNAMEVQAVRLPGGAQ